MGCSKRETKGWIYVISAQIPIICPPFRTHTHTERASRHLQQHCLPDPCPKCPWSPEEKRPAFFHVLRTGPIPARHHLLDGLVGIKVLHKRKVSVPNTIVDLTLVTLDWFLFTANLLLSRLSPETSRTSPNLLHPRSTCVPPLQI